MEGGVRKNSIYRRELPKKWGWATCRLKGGAGGAVREKEGAVLLRGGGEVDTSMHTKHMWLSP